MRYLTSTISEIFEKLYANLRRQYVQYAVNDADKVFFVFANINLNRSYKIPFYLSAEAAQDVSNPAGYLPADISNYYLRERPVFFYDQDTFIGARLRNAAYPENPKFILNIFLNGEYQDVYLNYDPNTMNAEIFVMDAGLFGDRGDEINALQSELSSVLAHAQDAYNKTQFLKSGDVAASSLITALQADPRFIIKVTRDCSRENYVQVTGGISLTWLHQRFEYQNTKTYLENRAIQMEKLTTILNKEVSKAGAFQVNPELLPAEEIQTTQPATTRKVPWGWIAAALGAVILASDGTSNRKHG